MSSLLSVRSIALACVAAAAAACTPVDPVNARSTQASVEPAEAQVAPAPTPSGQVITTLQTRDHEVTVYVTHSGPRFTVAAAGGVVLAEQLTVDEFRGSFPSLHERYDSAFAEDGVGLDASLTLPESGRVTTPTSPRSMR